MRDCWEVRARAVDREHPRLWQNSEAVPWNTTPLPQALSGPYHPTALLLPAGIRYVPPGLCLSHHLAHVGQELLRVVHDAVLDRVFDAADA